MPLRLIRQFLALEAASGLLLVAAAVLALAISNSSLAPIYDGLLQIELEIRLGTLQLEKPLLLWINDGLMAVFFFLVGLELKRELLVGELRSPQQLLLPGVAAIGGMVAPALIYLAINRSDPVSMAGWAIPTATDIAFALGVLSLLGNRVPPALKLFLLALAVIDDLLAIVVIAIFYSGQLSLLHLLLSTLCIAALATLNITGVRRTGPYLLIGSLFWIFVLKSGVHATLAGVITALFIPLKDSNAPSTAESSPLEQLEHQLHPYVAYLIVPIFGFANAGVSLLGLGFRDLLAPVPLGITLGLVLGKTIGVLLSVAVVRLLRVAPLPAGCHWGHMIGVSMLCGIGFTMSLFIASLAFQAGGVHAPGTDRLGILMGSLMAAVAGYTLLRFCRPLSTANP
ncbi:Na+/H+ antiporter NhaA [Permianibacter sp. IMCC34836]|uniref:Na+/H+ antiporter NhaA n=1 Tax=Permianibacter fluminis TaxID=2738515 RepID=UPI0015537D8D|nr:Na+/H+ antiporter NhaA [Permianibacter fluminis]NQD38750.1 Na+/H+ antiporter NhaA [Permianibacter fluminis]